MWLREISKAALQKSWNEVESLQCKHMEHYKIEAEQDKELNKCQAEEEVWHLRCVKAEEVHQAMILTQTENRLTRRHSDGDIKQMIEIAARNNENSKHHLQEGNKILSSSAAKPTSHYKNTYNIERHDANKTRLCNNSSTQQLSKERISLRMFRDKLCLLSTVNILGMEDDKHEPSSRKQDASPLTHSAHFPLGLPKILSLGMTKVKSVGSFENVGSFDTAGSFDSCKSTNINKPKANYFIEREVNTSSGNDESDHIHGCVNSQDELILKLSSCDETITCLEDTIYQHLKDMQSM